MNDSVNASTGYSPFYLVYGKQLRQIPEGAAIRNSRNEEDLAMKLSGALAKARENLRKVQEKMYEVWNRKRSKGDEIQEGDLVMLNRDGIKLEAVLDIKEKLKPLWLGPYRVLEKQSESHFKLELPPTLQRIHPVFHRERLKLFRDPRELFPSRVEHERPPMDETGEHEVKKIAGKRVRQKKVEYLVRGYPIQNRQWLKLSELQNCLDAIREYESGVESGGDAMDIRLLLGDEQLGDSNQLSGLKDTDDVTRLIKDRSSVTCAKNSI
jgi:hypothetical protein